MVNEIRHLRIKIDGLAQLAESLKPLIDQVYFEMNNEVKTSKKNSQEIKDTVKSLYMSRCWLGKSLKVLDVPNPYKNDGKRKEVSDIEPTADEDKGPNNMVGYNHLVFVYQWKKKNHIEKVDWLRQEIDKLDELLMTMNYNGEFKITDFFFLCYNNARTYLNEARFFLGFELQRLREENKEDMK